MNVSATHATSASSGLWNLLANRAAAATSASRSAAASGGSLAATTNATTTATTTTGTDAGTARPPGPPPPPGQFDLSGLSTSQFAGLGGTPPQDPIASLDSDGDGSVSAQEFGLDQAGSDVQKLFKAIDSDGSGSLSTDEIDQFRAQMMAADASSQGVQGPGGHHHPPHGADDPSGGTGTGSGGSSTATPPSLDVGAFIQQLAQRYASLSSGSASGTTASSLLNVSA